MKALSVVIGLLLLIASIADYAGHLWGRPSPHAAWLALVVMGLGFLLLFPDRLAIAIGYARSFLKMSTREHS